MTVAAYIEQLGAEMAKPSVKQHLAGIRQLFDYLVTGGILPSNPAGAVRGPKYVVKRGKIPVLSADQAQQLLDSIHVTGYRLNEAAAPNHYKYSTDYPTSFLIFRRDFTGYDAKSAIAKPWLSNLQGTHL
jgi:integrase